MEQENRAGQARTWIAVVLTDIHFWVPVIVLVGGLVLLRIIG